MTYLEKSEFKEMVILLCLMFMLGSILTLGVFLWGFNLGAKSSIGYALGQETGIQMLSDPIINNQTLYGKKTKK